MIEKICPYHRVPTPEGCCKRKEYNEILGIMEPCMAEPKDATTIYWCNVCNIPIFDKKCNCGCEGTYIGTDIRPVFPEEQMLLALILEMEKPVEILNKSVWHNGYAYILDGKSTKITLEKLNALTFSEISALKTKLDICLKELTYEYFDEFVNRFIEANRDRLNEITGEAINYIKNQAENFDDESMFVSFSGGKDSTVVSSLVMNAMASGKVIHIFGDTTLEFPYTYEYKKRFAKDHQIITAKNRTKNFEEMCPTYGPPSRVMRWCCTVFKTGAITDTIGLAYKDAVNILSFQGIRKFESASRSKYDKESNNSKIAKQKTVLPIFDWTDFDVWLYILSNKIDFNDAYRLGYTRVGCWCCPNNGAWSEFLSKIYMYDKSVHWREILIAYAQQVGKEDPEEYVDSGNWKARQGGNGLEAAQASVLSYEPCAIEDDTYNYELQRPIDDGLYELFKPFGWLDFDLGNKLLGEVYVLDKLGNPVLIIKGRKGQNSLKVTIRNKSKIPENKINCQITKYQMCSACGACKSVCKFGAIKLSESDDGDVSYTIDDDICKRCGECVSHFVGGCYMRKVLTIRRND